MIRSVFTRSLAMLLLCGAAGSPLCFAAGAPSGRYYEIQVVDEQTGRGVPLVDLETTNRMRYVTDNAGRVAFFEPGLMGQTVFFDVKTHGYEAEKDGFGIAGARLKVEEGGSGTIKLKRRNLAERLYRVTGYGLYRDTVLLGKEAPIAEPLGSGMVVGQDSVLAVPYRGKIRWFWGDTARISYPLGLFRMSGATSELPGKHALDPAVGVNLKYFVGPDGFSRAMAEVPNPEGVVWVFGVATVPDASGRERMVGHFTRRKGLAEEYEHGMMVYNDERDIFEVKTTLPLEDRWRFLHAQPVRVEADGKAYLYSGGPLLNVRVPATFEAVMDAKQYEAWTAFAPGADPEKAEPLRDANGAPQWAWRNAPPTDPKHEARWLKAGLIKPEHARFLPEDAEKAGKRVILHSGTVRWNEHRKRWVAIAVEFNYTEKNYPSPLGEVWYSEAESPIGPFAKAVKVVTHDKQTFYNPCHHTFFDQDGGRVIYFEGTYTNQFVGSPPTPLYDYNQIMYRLDLDHPRLRDAFPR